MTHSAAQTIETLRMRLAESTRTAEALRQRLDQLEGMTAALAEHVEADERELHDARAALAAQADALFANDSETPGYQIALALTLANAAYDALLVLDSEHRIIGINDSAEHLFGRKRPIGETLDSVTGSPELTALVEDALANAEEFLEEQFTFNKRFYRVRVQVLHRQPHTFIGIALQDVSDLVRLNRARRDMVANISHELRTPIANIRLIIDSLFHEQDKPKRKQSTSALKAIARESDSLLWLVQELLDLSMIESGQSILRMVDFPLRPLVEDVVERMIDQSEAKDLRFAVQVDADVEVLADDDQLRRVLVNLVHNAIKWSPNGGTITVEAQAEGDEVTIGVFDEGEGVPDDQTERIFERFYQVDASRSKGEGSGLGLAICKHIVEAHGGRIWAEGSYGGVRPGGRFRFTLARAEGKSAAFDGAAAPEHEQAGHSVERD